MKSVHFLPSHMEQSKIEKSWERLLKSYDIPTFAKKKLLVPIFAKQNYLEPILDAGCGTGFFSNFLADRGYFVVSIDKNINLSHMHSCRAIKANIELFHPNNLLVGDVLLINVLSCAEPKRRLKILQNLKKIKAPTAKIFVINSSEKMGDKNFKSRFIKAKKVAHKTVHLVNKKIDSSVLEFDDYLITKEEFMEYCKEANLKIIKQKELSFSGERFPIFNFYTLE